MWKVYLNDIDINDQSRGMHLDEPIEGLTELPPIRTSQGENLGRDGGWTSKQLYESRFISFNGRIFGSTPAETERRRRDFLSMLSKITKNSAVLRVITPAGYEFSTEVVLMDVKIPVQRVLNVVEWKINLKADDPLLYDSGEGELLAEIRKSKAGGFLIGFDIPLYIGEEERPQPVFNAGNETVYPVVRISTKATSPKLFNQTTGQAMLIDATVRNGDVLEVDMKNRTILLNGANIYNAKLEGSDFWGLEPGNNFIELLTSEPSEESVAEIRYRSGFIGI